MTEEVGKSAKAETKTGEAKADAKAETPTETSKDAPKNHSRGEGQKPVTQSYRDNWNAIYGKKKRRS
jgi:hypothetical protein